MVFVARLCSMMCLLLVNGCWVGRNAVSGLLVFVGGDSCVLFCHGCYLFTHLHITHLHICSVNLKNDLCCRIV